MTDHPLGERKSTDEDDAVERLREIIHEAQERMAKYLDEGHLDPEKVVRRGTIRVTVVSGGKSPWLQEVGGPHARNELEIVAARMRTGNRR